MDAKSPVRPLALSPGVPSIYVMFLGFPSNDQEHDVSNVICGNNIGQLRYGDEYCTSFDTQH
jgi:hypothetical protein